jgi:DNA end-binding protein Ku
MVSSRTRAIPRVVLYHRERAVLLEPRDKGMLLWTLRYGDEVRDAKDYVGGMRNKRADRKEKKLVSELIRQYTKPCSPSLTTNPVQKELISAREQAARGRAKESARPRGPMSSMSWPF